MLAKCYLIIKFKDPVSWGSVVVSGDACKVTQYRHSPSLNYLPHSCRDCQVLYRWLRSFWEVGYLLFEQEWIYCLLIKRINIPWIIPKPAMGHQVMEQKSILSDSAITLANPLLTSFPRWTVQIEWVSSHHPRLWDEITCLILKVRVCMKTDFIELSGRTTALKLGWVQFWHQNGGKERRLRLGE